MEGEIEVVFAEETLGVLDDAFPPGGLLEIDGLGLLIEDVLSIVLDAVIDSDSEVLETTEEMENLEDGIEETLTVLETTL